MATQELALKLQRRLRLEQESEAAQGPQQNGLDGEGRGLPAESARARNRSPPKAAQEPPAKELTANADSELKAQLSRRQSIHEGTARPRPKVFKPHTEFPEFSRRQIKDMESLFRRFAGPQSLAWLVGVLGFPAPHTELGVWEISKAQQEAN
ncbi:EF-hand domain-containing protein D1-like [Sminthopsis crassicaudata]|uniref:EF-hand domain-containing protein D1-like n=1 Tax=Sminthopsis crassicaudata TaxID=9301 RepID=UPI003D69F026